VDAPFKTEVLALSEAVKLLQVLEASDSQYSSIKPGISMYAPY
jgi:hypothetical protein